MNNKYLSKAAFMFYMFCLSLIPRQVRAAVIAPVTSDMYWYSACNNGMGSPAYIAGINTAMIDMPTPNALIKVGTLMACAYYGNGTGGGVEFRDLNSGNMVSIPYCGTGNLNVPDIIVGNDATLPGTDFRVAVAHGGNKIDFYLVHYTNLFSGTFVVSPILLNWVIPPASGEFIHLDVIAEAANTIATGMPWCDKFVVSYGTSTTTFGAVYCSLNAPGTILNTMAPIPGTVADVAAIQRQVGVLVDDMALFGYLDAAGNQVWYTDWNCTTGGMGLATGLGPTFGVNGVRMPRIDAPDDFNINTPSPFNAYYKIAAHLLGMWIGTFDNMLAGLYWNPYGAASGFYGAPCVAFGGNSNTQYQVAHYETVAPNVMMMPIDWTLSTAPAPPGDWFIVNLFPLGFINGDYLTSISTPCNDPDHMTLVTWTYFNTITNQSDVYFKVSYYTPPGGYFFRQAAPTGVAQAAQQDWAIYPNPATDVLQVNAPVGSTYQVTDMPGRVVAGGTLLQGKTTINLGQLSTGSYLFTLYNNGIRNGTRTFVKQ